MALLWPFMGCLDRRKPTLQACVSILRKIAANEVDGLGDTSTLADPGVVTELVANRVG